MQPILRQQFNNAFTPEKYAHYLAELNALHPGVIDFRIAETPVFVPKEFTQQMLEACEHVIDLIVSPEFKKITEAAIPTEERVPDENEYPECISFDFGICEDEADKLVPQLIEMQAFPSLFAFQVFFTSIAEGYAVVPDNYSGYLNGYTKETYIQLLKDIIVGEHAKENVILLDIFPEQQKTRMDFYCTEDILGIKTVCITQLLVEGDQLFYDNNGTRIPIKRIYNRLIMDDLKQQDIPAGVIDLTKKYTVEWVTHPNWFYRVSKFILPFLKHSYIPESYFLSDIKQLKGSLSDYVLKPLFSFAGMGVVIDITQKDIDDINDPWNWILQRKVTYAAAIQTPDEPAKAEIRLFYFWKKGWARPVAAHNLARLSKGKMIGTRYNQNKTWVGGSLAFFEQ